MMKERSYVKASSYRKGVLRALEDGPKLVSTLSEELDIALQNVSRTLRELEEKKLVKCLEPEKKKGREYALTEKGKRLAQELPSAQMAATSSSEEGVGLGGFESHVSDALDEAQAPYAKNFAIEGKDFSRRPDFVVLDNSKPSVALEVKEMDPEDLSEARKEVRDVALPLKHLKESNEELETIFIVGGIRKDDPQALKLLELKDDYFDEVFFENELEELASHIQERIG